MEQVRKSGRIQRPDQDRGIPAPKGPAEDRNDIQIQRTDRTMDPPTILLIMERTDDPPLVDEEDIPMFARPFLKG